MTWQLVAQIAALAVVLGVVVVICGGGLHGTIVDKRYEDALRRKKENV